MKRLWDPNSHSRNLNASTKSSLNQRHSTQSLSPCSTRLKARGAGPLARQQVAFITNRSLIPSPNWVAMRHRQSFQLTDHFHSVHHDQFCKNYTLTESLKTKKKEILLLHLTDTKHLKVHLKRCRLIHPQLEWDATSWQRRFRKQNYLGLAPMHPHLSQVVLPSM